MPTIWTDRAGDLGAVYDAVLVPHFPADETPDRAAFLDDARSGRLRVLVSRDEDELLGAAVVSVISPHTSLLAWLAVSEAARGKGTGGQLLRHLLAQPDLAHERLLFAEIEHPGQTPTASAHGDPARRARFYARHGARAVCVPHWQPPMRPTEQAVALQLIAFPQSSAPGLTTSVLTEFEQAYLGRLQDGPIWTQVMSALSQGRGEVATADLISLYPATQRASTR